MLSAASQVTLELWFESNRNDREGSGIHYCERLKLNESEGFCLRPTSSLSMYRYSSDNSFIETQNKEHKNLSTELHLRYLELCVYLTSHLSETEHQLDMNLTPHKLKTSTDQTPGTQFQLPSLKCFTSCTFSSIKFMPVCLHHFVA